MKLVDTAIKKPVTVTVGVILLVLFGFISLFRIPIQLTPNVDLEVELKKLETIFNTSTYNVKIENGTEKLKAYYTELDNFYKKYYPDWYNSAEYKQLVEDYYRF